VSIVIASGGDDTDIVSNRLTRPVNARIVGTNSRFARQVRRRSNFVGAQPDGRRRPPLYADGLLRARKRCLMRCMQIRPFARVGAMVVFACLCAVPPVPGQTTRARLTGTVTDPNGAVVPGAVVDATNIATNIGSSTKTNDDGTYTFTALAPGEYTVAVEVPGFKRNVLTGVILQIAETSRRFSRCRSMVGSSSNSSR
jgi:hypothetical protein